MTPIPDDPLLQRLESFSFDAPGASLDFTRRLARDNRWSRDFAERVIREYLRFVYLMARSQRELTPSDQVDQAWHMHLCYSRSYWQDLCAGILGGPLHHGPTRGGRQEQTRFRGQYEYTLALYQQTFGTAPPADIWPSPARRFADAEQFTRVNQRDYWLIPRPSPRHIRLGALLGSAALLLAACSESADNSDFWFYVKLLIALPGIYWLVRFFMWMSSGNRRGSGCGGSGCGGIGGGDSSGGDSGCGGGGCGGCGG